MSARDIGNAVRKPINMVRFLGCSALVNVRAVGAHSHGARNILAWTWDLLRDVDGAIGAAVSVSFIALSKSASTGGVDGLQSITDSHHPRCAVIPATRSKT